jgi:hypothetical protein
VPAVDESLNVASELPSTLSCAFAFVDVPLKVMEPPFNAIRLALAAEVDGELAAELPKTMLAVFARSVGALELVICMPAPSNVSVVSCASMNV